LNTQNTPRAKTPKAEEKEKVQVVETAKADSVLAKHRGESKVRSQVFIELLDDSG
jgi:hypothetical protein